MSFRILTARLMAPLTDKTQPAAPSQGLSIALSYDESYIGGIALNMNPQSKGTVTLGSANPLDPPVIDPRLLTHPYDRRVLIESVRDTMKFFSTPIFKSKTLRTVSWPEDDSDEAIWVGEKYEIWLRKLCEHELTEHIRTTSRSTLVAAITCVGQYGWELRGKRPVLILHSKSLASKDSEWSTSVSVLWSRSKSNDSNL